MKWEKFDRLLRRAIAAAAVSAMCVTVAGAAYMGVGTVNTSSGLRLRSGPSGDSSVILSVPGGEKVAVRALMDGGWYKVYYKGQMGYMSNDYVDLNTKAVNADMGYGKVSAGGSLNVRSGPGTSYDKVSKIKDGTVVKLIGMDSGWFKISWDGGEGYVSSDYIDMNTKEVTASTSLGNGKVTAGGSLNVRSGPSTDADKVGKLKDGTVVKLTGLDSDWFKISWNGIEGYVSSDYITVCNEEVTPVQTEAPKAAEDPKPAATPKPDPTPEPVTQPAADADADAAAQVVAYAKSFLGVPYVWGANGPNSFDCSGFTKYVYGHFGYSLGRTVSAQMTGAAVAKGEWQPGDLIFFSRNGSRPSHVGMYVGGGEFIHASTNGSNEVKISPLTSGYYDRVYIGAYRIL